MYFLVVDQGVVLKAGLSLSANGANGRAKTQFGAPRAKTFPLESLGAFGAWRLELKQDPGSIDLIGESFGESVESIYAILLNQRITPWTAMAGSPHRQPWDYETGREAGVYWEGGMSTVVL